VLLQRLATREKWIPTRQERAGRSALFFVGVDVPAGTPNSPFLSGLQGTLQRFESGVWQDYRLNGEAIISILLDIESLPPGKYRVLLVAA
jgi:hypothetical protein